MIEFLADEDMHREFMAALILHDIGHAPFSHVLEMNPHLGYNHEKVTEELIKGGHSSNYLELEDLLVSSYVDLEYGYNEEYGIPQSVVLDKDKACGLIRTKDKFVLVHDVIESMKLDEDIIVGLFSDEYSKDPAVSALKGLVHGVIDIDRIDHIYRDLHYNSFKTMGIPLTSLFHGMTIHYGDALKEGKEPWIVITEEITPIVETLLAARELSNKAIFDNPVNNFYIGVLNNAISCGVIMMPLLKYYLPYLTDEALLHVLTSKDLFHNLSPTEKVGIITSSSFGHSSYHYRSYKIRERRTEGEMIPDKKLKNEVLKAISDVAEEKDVLWYAFLKDARRDYGILNEEKKYLEPQKLGIEKLYTGMNRTQWFLASVLFVKGIEEDEVKKRIKTPQEDDEMKEIFGNTKYHSFEELWEEAKDGEKLKKKIKELIGEEASSIFLRELSTKIYIGTKEPKNKLEEGLKAYIKGITWAADDNRSWTFAFFAENVDGITSAKSALERKIRDILQTPEITKVAWGKVH